MKPILDLPPGISHEQLLTIVNDRLRDIQGNFQVLVENPSSEDVDLGAHKITNLADPRNDMDAVNLRTLKRTGIVEEQPIKKVSGSVYTAVFTLDGFLETLMSAPSFGVDIGNEGVPLRAWAHCKGAPTADASFNFTVILPGKTTADAITILTADIVIPSGSTEMAFSTGLRFRSRMAKKSLIDIVVVEAGGGSGFTAGLMVQR